MAIAAWWRSLSPESSGAQQMVVVAWWRSLSPESSGARQPRTSRLSGGRYRPNQAALGGDPFSCPRRADAACARRGSLRFVREVDPVARAIEPLESRSSSPVPSAARSRSLPLPPVGAVRSRLLSPVQAALGLSRLSGDRYRPNQAALGYRGLVAIVIAPIKRASQRWSSRAWWRSLSPDQAALGGDAFHLAGPDTAAVNSADRCRSCGGGSPSPGLERIESRS